MASNCTIFSELRSPFWTANLVGGGRQEPSLDFIGTSSIESSGFNLGLDLKGFECRTGGSDSVVEGRISSFI